MVCSYRRFCRKNNAKVIVITDAHIDNPEEADFFFKMLEKISFQEYPVIFLGDIFELWIALPKYENKWQKKFLEWCLQQKEKPFFIEGNHEFFVNNAYDGKNIISDEKKISPNGVIVYNNVVFCHGDRFHEKDIGYRSFRFAIRNCVTKFLMTILPGVAKLVDKIHLKMKRHNKDGCYLPIEQILEYAHHLKFRTNTFLAVLGHFHQQYEISQPNHLILLPAWQGTQKIALVNTLTEEVQVGTWQEILENK